MYKEKVVQILSDEGFEQELKQRGARVVFEHVLELKGIGSISGMIQTNRVEIYPSFFRDVETLTISASDAQIIVQYMLDSGNN